MVDAASVRFLSAAIVAPPLVPMVFLLFPHWRYPRRTIGWVAAAAELAMLGCIGLIHHLLGPTPLALVLVGTLPAALCALLFLRCSPLRDGRLLFTMVTIALDTSICDVVTSFFAARDDPVWPALKLLLFLIQGAIILRFFRAPFLDMLSSDHIQWGQVAVIPLSLCAGLCGYYLEALTPESRQIPVFPALLLCIAVVLVYVTLYRFQRALLAHAQTQRYNDLLRSELDFLHRQTALAQQAGDQMRVFRHDIRHYAQLLRGCLAQQDVSAACDVLDRLEENERGAPIWTPLTEYTGNVLLDTVLTQAAQRAQQLHVTFSVALTLPGRLRVDLSELAVVLSNAVENAVSAAAKEPSPRMVSVQSLPCRQELFLLISNTFSGTVELDERTRLPRADRPEHGYGTHSISMFATKYGCLLDHTIQDGRFTLRLLI